MFLRAYASLLLNYPIPKLYKHLLFTIQNTFRNQEILHVRQSHSRLSYDLFIPSDLTVAYEVYNIVVYITTTSLQLRIYSSRELPRITGWTVKINVFFFIYILFFPSDPSHNYVL